MLTFFRGISKGNRSLPYYRIPSDVRDLNYNKYFDKGKKNKLIESYSSDKVKILNEDS